MTCTPGVAGGCSGSTSSIPWTSPGAITYGASSIGSSMAVPHSGTTAGSCTRITCRVQPTGAGEGGTVTSTPGAATTTNSGATVGSSEVRKSQVNSGIGVRIVL